jgi:hypothetical protein
MAIFFDAASSEQDDTCRQPNPLQRHACPLGPRRTVQPIAVVVDLVIQLEPDGGLSAGDGRQGSMKPAAVVRLVRELNEDMAGR